MFNTRDIKLMAASSGVTLAVVTAMVVGPMQLGTPAMAEKQGHMQAALKTLQTAWNQLEKATPDKGGHRMKAMEHTKMAIDEVKAGMAYDNKH